MSNEPETIVPKIVRWGRRFGSTSLKFGNYLGGKRGGKGQGSNSRGKPRSIQALLVADAMTKGWLNGERLARR